MTKHRANRGNMTSATFIFFLIMLFSSCRSLEIMKSQWLSVPVDDQGRMEDFSRHLTSHLYENGMLAGVGNDEKYLYIFFSPDIRHHVRPPSRASLTLWLDRGGNKTRKFGFFYTRTYFPEDTNSTRTGMKPAPPELDDSRRSKPPAPNESLLQVIDTSNKIKTFISPDGSQGPQIHFSSDWGDFVYAWRIPIATGEKGDFFGLDAQPGQAVGIGLIWEIKPLFAAKKPDGAPGPGIDGPPGGRGGRGGMGRGGPRPGADFFDLPAHRKIWLKIILAHK